MLTATSYRGVRIKRVGHVPVEVEGQSIWEIEGIWEEDGKDNYGLPRYKLSSWQPKIPLGTWNDVIQYLNSADLPTPVPPHHVCKICGTIETGFYNTDGKSRLDHPDLCFECDYWMCHIEKERGQYERPIILGVHYVIGERNNYPPSSKGFGGRLFVIKFNDGTVVATDNLWYQGAIPQRFRDKLPDNAEFIRNTI